jgi:selenocysteine-specific elongation factor
MLVFGTAGHVDHGKSSLVKVLTGIDPTHLPEEKRRGLTIEIGFAWLELPGGERLGLVDVPGHERYVRNMVTGVGGIDGFIFVVAADDGWMPQSEEHMQILKLLGVGAGIAVLSKVDLVDPGRRRELADEVQLRLWDSLGCEIPVFPFSAITREGLPDIREALFRLAGSLRGAPDGGRARLWIDRVFTVQGAGTVVTGTLRDGKVSVGSAMEILPSGIGAEVRGIQSYGCVLECAEPGSRVALNLSKVRSGGVSRGDCLVSSGEGWMSDGFDGQTTVLEPASKLGRKNVEVEIHIGTRVVRALSIPFRERSGSEPEPVRYKLKGKTPLRFADRFLVRTRGQSRTLGGGWVLDPDPVRSHRSALRVIDLRREPALAGFLLGELEKRPRVSIDQAVRMSSFAHDEIDRLLEDPAMFYRRGNWVTAAERFETGRRSLLRQLADFHERHLSVPGLSLHDLAWPSGIDEVLSEEILRLLQQKGEIRVEARQVRLASHQETLSGGEQAVAREILAVLRKASFDAQSGHALYGEEPERARILDFLVRTGAVTSLGQGRQKRFMCQEDFDRAASQVREMIRAQGAVVLREVRDRFGSSRAAVQAFLEEMDRRKITRFDGDRRTLGGAQSVSGERGG